MAVLSILTFDDQTHGSAPTVSDPWVYYNNGSDWLVTSNSAVHGSRGIEVNNATAYSRFQYSQTATNSTRVLSFYFKITSLSGQAYLATAISNGDPVCNWRVNADRTVTIRNRLSAVDTSAQQLSLGQTYRSEWRISNTGQTLRIFTGESTTPLFTLNGAVSDNTHDILSVGVTSATDGISLSVDTIRVADDWVGPFASSSEGSTHFWIDHQRNLRPMIISRNPQDDTPPTPPPPPKMLLGSSSSDNWDQFNAKLINDGSKPGAVNNGLACRRSYSPGGIVPNFMSTAAAPDVANGVASIWSCKPDINQVANGSLDATFTSFFNSIPAGHQAWLMLWHEPWDDDFDWPTYRAAQKRAWTLLQDSNADTNLVKWGILGTASDFTQQRAHLFFPEDGSFDYVGCDPYDFYRNLNVMPASPRGRNGHRSPQQILGATVDFANSVGKPIVIGEFGFHPDPENPNGPANWQGVASRPHRLEAFVDYMANNNVVAATYFNAPNGDDGPWWLTCFHNFADPSDQSNVDQHTMAKMRDLLAVYGKQ